MPANLTTLPHFSVSSAMNLPNSTGDIGIGSAPKLGETRLHLGICESGGINLFAEFVDDLGGRALWRANPIPSTRDVARHELVHDRDVR